MHVWAGTDTTYGQARIEDCIDYVTMDTYEKLALGESDSYVSRATELSRSSKYTYRHIIDRTL